MISIEDYESVFNSIFSLMAKFDDDEDSNEVTLFELKDDLDNFPEDNLRKLAALLIGSMDESTTENLTLNEKLILCEGKNTSLLAQGTEMNARIRMLEYSNITVEKEPSISENYKRKLSVLRKN